MNRLPFSSFYFSVFLILKNNFLDKQNLKTCPMSFKGLFPHPQLRNCFNIMSWQALTPEINEKCCNFLWKSFCPPIPFQYSLSPHHHPSFAPHPSIHTFHLGLRNHPFEDCRHYFFTFHFGITVDSQEVTTQYTSKSCAAFTQPSHTLESYLSHHSAIPKLGKWHDTNHAHIQISPVIHLCVSSSPVQFYYIPSFM